MTGVQTCALPSRAAKPPPVPPAPLAPSTFSPEAVPLQQTGKDHSDSGPRATARMSAPMPAVHGYAPTPPPARAAVPVAPSAPVTPTAPPAHAFTPAPAFSPAPPVASAKPARPRSADTRDLIAALGDRLEAELGLRDLPLEALADDDLWRRAKSAASSALDALLLEVKNPGDVDRDAVMRPALDEALGVGPLEGLLADDTVTEILVARPQRIFVTQGGTRTESSVGFSSENALRRAIERLAASSGHALTPASPFVDLRLRDGTRLVAGRAPAAAHGGFAFFRKAPPARSLERLVKDGVLSQNMADFLSVCVAGRKNIIVSGAPGAGRSELLSALAQLAGPDERVVSVEPVAELSLPHAQWIALEAPAVTSPASGALAFRDLVHAALRISADRLVVSDLNGPEALDLVSAMGENRDGVLLALAAAEPVAALSRLEALGRLAGALHMKELIVLASDVIVHVARYGGGGTRVASIHEMVGVSRGAFVLEALFGFSDDDEEAQFVATGKVPTFCEDLRQRGIVVDEKMFS